MKKRIAWMLALCLILSVLSACGAKVPAEPETQEQQESAAAQTEPQEQAEPAQNEPAQPAGESDGPQEEPEQTPEEPPAREGYGVEGRYFTLWLPREWEDQVIIEESAPEESNYYLSVCHKASREANGAGHLFSLILEDNMVFVTYPSYQVVGVLSDGTVSRNLIALFPTDVQAAEGLFEEYSKLFDNDVMNQVFSQIEPKQGWTLQEMPEDVLYNAQARYEYQNTMYGVYFRGELPNGMEVVPEGWDAKIDDSHFAVLDVDGDGRDELMISVDDSYMAGMVTVTYRMDGYSMEEELSVFPGANYYTGGLVQAFSSHNHTFGELWPYTLFQYDGVSEVYNPVASVYGWNRDYSEMDYDGNPFPEDVDADGNGVVVSITEGDSQRWVDDDAFQQWEAERFAGAEEIEIPWLPITEENIGSALGWAS